MHPIFWRWITPKIYFFLSSAHSPLHHSIPYEFSHPRCPSQGIFPPPAIQTLVPFSGNNWSVGWSCCSASLCCLLDVLGSGTLEPLSIRIWRSLHHRLYIVLVSLLTMTAISVDRLLALLLGLRYKQIVTLKRTYIIVTTFWVFNLVASLSGFFYHRIIFMYSSLVISFCLVISVASYTKIFCTLRYHQAQVRDQQQLSQTNALNMARFRKAVYSALWVQLALVVCYAPTCTIAIVIAHTKKYSLLLVVTRKVAVTFVYFNSTLNPFLYCWKISEVRQAVKQTIREALCWVMFPSSCSSDFESRLLKSRLLLERSR